MPNPAMVTVRGVDLAVYREHAGGAAGDRPAVVCLHETGASAASWRPLTESLKASGRFQAVRYDRRGWGASELPRPYLRTTVAEQAQDALGLLDALGLDRALLCGSGLGGVAALDLALREPARVAAVIAVEPPLLALAEGATEGLSKDAERLREAAEADGGRQAAARLFAAGELPFIAPGSARLAARERAGGGEGDQATLRPAGLLAELGAVPAWPLPFTELAATTVPIYLVIGRGSPPSVRAAVDALAGYTASARLVDLEVDDPLAAGELAKLAAAAWSSAADRQRHGGTATT